MTIDCRITPPMLTLNLRQGDSTWRFAKRHQWMAGNKPITDERAAEILSGKVACCFTHGYRVKEPDDAYARIMLEMLDKYQVFIGVKWPGSQFGLGFWGAGLRAPRAGRMLAAALMPLSCAALDIEGHSLGCKVTVEALAAGLCVRNCILAAPAVDNESIQRGEKYAIAPMRAQRLIVAHSRRDSVLAGAYVLGSADGALGYGGPQNPKECADNVQVVDCTATADGHSAYKSDPTFLAAWREIA